MTAGAAGVIGLLVARAQIASDPSHERWWQVSMVAAIVTTCIGGYIVLAALFVESLPLPRLRETEEVPAPPQQPVIVTIPPASPVPQKAKRILLDKTPAEIVRPFKEHTTMQAERLVEAYLDRWIRVNGEFDDISAPVYEQAVVSFASSRRLILPHVFMYFSDDEAIRHLSTLRRGTPIKVEGRIARISAHEVVLQDCELVV